MAGMGEIAKECVETCCLRRLVILCGGIFLGNKLRIFTYQ